MAWQTKMKRRIARHPVPKETFGESSDLILQPGRMDCGATCLAMVCKYHGVSVSLDRLRDLAGVTDQGATLAGLADAAKALGFTARGMRAGFEDLASVSLPVIVHWEGRHFIVVCSFRPGEVLVADPARGLRRLSRSKFEGGWRGILLAMQPDRRE